MNEEMKAFREKTWPELTDSEKIERMRGVVKNLQRECRSLSARLSPLRYHEHGEGGKILIPIDGTIKDEERPSHFNLDWF